MATVAEILAKGDLSVYREYHAKRSRERRERREALRRQNLETARESIRRLAPGFPPIRAVYLFGSVLEAGHFSRHSDVDVAIECDEIAVEGPFRRALEEKLRRDVDLRPLEGRVKRVVEAFGECVYEREISDSGT